MHDSPDETRRPQGATIAYPGESDFLTAQPYETATSRNLDRAIIAMLRRASDPLRREYLVLKSCADASAELLAPPLASREWLRAADRYVSEATLTLIRAPNDAELAAVVVMVKRLADEQRHRLSAH